MCVRNVPRVQMKIIRVSVVLHNWQKPPIALSVDFIAKISRYRLDDATVSVPWFTVRCHHSHNSLVHFQIAQQSVM